MLLERGRVKYFDEETDAKGYGVSRFSCSTELRKFDAKIRYVETVFATPCEVKVYLRACIKVEGYNAAARYYNSYPCKENKDLGVKWLDQINEKYLALEEERDTLIQKHSRGVVQNPYKECCPLCRTVLCPKEVRDKIESLTKDMRDLEEVYCSLFQRDLAFGNEKVRSLVKWMVAERMK